MSKLMHGIDYRSGSREVELRDCFVDPLLDVMNFLNHITYEYPRAISFAPGRPPDKFFDVERHLKAIRCFVSGRARRIGKDEQEVWRELGQYGPTNGIINDLIAHHLERDEKIIVPPDAIMVTVGAQEAMAVIIFGLFDSARDVLLVSDPGYIGVTGAARIAGVRTIPVPSGEGGLDPDKVEEAVRQCPEKGRARALYDVPNFNNPSGTVLSPDRREALLAVCAKYDMFFIEDNAYGAYVYEGEKPATLKAIDRDGTVLYIGTFSKTLFPGLRLGYLVADQRVKATGELLAKELSRIKGLLTVNSSSLMQAVVGGVLLENEGSLQQLVDPKVQHLRRNRDAMLQNLATEFSDMQGLVSWNRPCGGFFLTVTLPFGFGKEELIACAADFGVIVCPMRFFTLGPDHDRQIRLSFSSLETEQISAGVERLAMFVRGRMAGTVNSGSFHVSGAIP